MLFYNSYQSKSWHRTLFDGVDERMYKISPIAFTSDNEGSIFAYFTFNSVTVANNGFINIAGMGDTNAAANQINIGLRRDDALFPTNKPRIAILSGISSSFQEVLGSTNITTGVLYHLVITSNGSTWKIYLNGVEETLTAKSGTNTGRWFSDHTWPGTPRFAIGNVFRQNAWAPVSLNGYIGGFGITGEVLSQTTITNLYNNNKPVDPYLYLDKTLMRTYWTMGDLESGIINPTYDACGNNNLTVENMENADIVPSNYY